MSSSMFTETSTGSYDSVGVCLYLIRIHTQIPAQTVRLWDMRARQRLPLQILDDAKDSVVDIYISGDRIYTASVDGYLRTYDLRAGQLRQDFLDCLSSLLV